MPFPSISGVLNNCPLHVLTPELRTEIQSLADESYDLSVEVKEKYEILKTEFALFYDIDPSNFSWKRFYARLENHNGFDLQIILGPVLRKFMAKMMENHSSTAIAQAGDERFVEKSTAEFIAYKTEVQEEDGRYASLSPDEMFLFVAAPLGLTVAYHQDAERRVFEPSDPGPRQRRRSPLIEMFHQGGVEGASAGGHFERTENVSERIDYEKDLQGSHLRVVAGLFRNDTPAITALGLQLLCLYMRIAAQPKRERREMIQTFRLTASQIEKYLYNRLYVDSKTAKLLVGDLTHEAAELLQTLPELPIDSDAGVLTLIQHHHPSFRHYNRPIKAELSEQQYQVALTIMTPAVAQTQAHSYRTSTETSSRTWPLRGNEIVALQTLTHEYVEHVLYDQGLSLQLYALCNQAEIARELSPEFLDLLGRDPSFTERALADLQTEVTVRRTPPSRLGKPWAPGQLGTPSRVRSAVHFAAAYSSPVQKGGYSSYDAMTPASTLDMHEIFSGNFSPEERIMPANLRRTQLETPFERRFIQSPSTARCLTPEFVNVDGSRSDEEGSYDSQIRRPVSKKLFTEHTSKQPLSPPVNSFFWLRAMQACFAIGGLCAIVALLTCPPVATALGLSTVLGVTVSDITVTATFVATSSALLAASFFAMRQTMDDPVQAPRPALGR